MTYRLVVECDTKQDYDNLVEFMSKNKSNRQDKEKRVKDTLVGC